MRRFCKKLVDKCYILLLLLVLTSSCVSTSIDRELSKIPVDQVVLSYQLEKVEEHLDEIILILVQTGRISEKEVLELIKQYENRE